MTLTPGATLRLLRERRPLVHHITNYVVMNETANMTLCLGALPVMAHAVEEVEEMVGYRRRARAQHRHADPELDRRDVDRRQGREPRRRAGRARPRGRRRDKACAPTPPPLACSPRSTSPWSAATSPRSPFSPAARPRSSGVESIGGQEQAAEVAAGARPAGVVHGGRHRQGGLGVGRNPHALDRERRSDARDDHRLGLHDLGDLRGLPGRAAGPPSRRQPAPWPRSGWRGSRRTLGAKGPGTFHASLYDALAAVSPDTLDGRIR